MLNFKISKEHEEVIIPTKRYDDAGYDYYLDRAWLKEIHNGKLVISPNETVMIPTGVRTNISSDYYIQVHERGSTGIKGMKYGAGVIDSSFNGVHNVVITNCNKSSIVIYDPELHKVEEKTFFLFYPCTKAIAQFVILPVPKVKFEEVSVEEILEKKTHRGEGKLGSSGK